MHNSPDNHPKPDPSSAPSTPPDASVHEVNQLRYQNRKVREAKRLILFSRIRNSIYFLVGMLEVLLALRFVLRLSGANPENLFAKSIYGLSGPFMFPFSTLFISPVENTDATLGQNIFDVNLLIAMIVYALLGFLAVWIVDYIYRQITSPSA